MSDARLEELLNAELDQALAAGEQQELQKLLSSSQSATDNQAAYRQLDELLRKLPDQPLPVALRERIVSASKLPASASKRESRSGGKLFESPVVRFSFAAAAGVFLSLLVFNVVDPNLAEAPNKDMLGSMVPHANSAGDLVIDRMQLIGAGYATGVALLESGERMQLVIDLDAASPVEIAVDFSNSGMQFESVSQGGDSLEAVSYSAPVLRMSGRGKRNIQVSLSREDAATAAKSATIQLEISSDGQRPQQGTLSLPR